MIQPRPSRWWIVAPLIAALAVLPASADRLHLESGGSIDVETWWIEGDWLMYEGADGTIGIPRASVKRIESGEQSPAASGMRGWNAPQPPDPGGTTRSGSVADPARIRDLLERAQAALQARDYERASSHFLEALNSTPGLYVARVGYAVSEIALGRDGLAISVIQDGLAEDPNRSELHEVLGDLRNREERVDEALASWKRAFELAPNDRLREKIFKAERELHASRDYEFAASSHFNLRYDEDVEPGLASSVMEHLEEELWALSDLYRHTPPQPITVQLYPRQEFRDVTQAPGWVGGLYDGKIRVPLGGLNRLHPRAREVLSHELTHAVVHSKTRGNCPRWLHEGLAQITERKALTRTEQQQVAERLGSGDPVEWEQGGFSYPLALSLTRHLESRQGFDAVVYLLQLLGEGSDLDPALYAVYGLSYAELCAGWARAVNEER